MINRRSFLIASSLAMAVQPGRVGAATALVPLWPNKPVGGGGPTGPIRTNAKGAISNIAVPNLKVFTPIRPNGAAMLVAAGGGYKRIEMATEALPAVRWLADRGITAFVLSYRLPMEGWNDGPMAPLQDAQRALRLIRDKAARYDLDSSRIGLLGFSAGGHLMGLAATRSEFQSYQPQDEVDAQSAQAAVAALIYPIITLEPPYDQTSTRRALIGDHPDLRASSEWSVETHVRSVCPPIFLTQAEDDPISNPRNTVIMADACRRAGVPVEMHQLPSGGHGFGMGEAGTPTAAWPDWYEAWLSRNGIGRKA